MKSLELLLPAVILIWGIFLPGSSINRELNDMRDKILDAGTSYTLEHRKLIYSDWRGMFWAAIGYQVFLFCLVLLLVWKFLKDPEQNLLGVICIALAAMSIVRFINYIRAFWFSDRLAIEKALMAPPNAQH